MVETLGCPGFRGVSQGNALWFNSPGGSGSDVRGLSTWADVASAAHVVVSTRPALPFRSIAASTTTNATAANIRPTWFAGSSDGL